MNHLRDIEVILKTTSGKVIRVGSPRAAKGFMCIDSIYVVGKWNEALWDKWKSALLFYGVAIINL